MAAIGGHLKWVPGRCRRKFEIADVVSKPQPEPGADGHTTIFVDYQSAMRNRLASFSGVSPNSAPADPKRLETENSH